MTEPEQPKHVGVHDCDHECDCFWCKVSRKEPFEPIEDTMEVQ